jgi:hypothetical protein
MPSRAEILKRVFKKGVQSYSEKDLAKLFKGRKDKLYRVDAGPEELFKKGFTKSRQGLNFPVGEEMGDNTIPGLYWGKTPNDVSVYTDFNPREINVRGLPRPGAKVLRNPGGGPLPDEEAVAKAYDFIQNIEGSKGELSEVLQLKPNNVLAKIDVGKGKTKKSLYRILALLGLLKGSEEAQSVK